MNSCEFVRLQGNEEISGKITEAMQCNACRKASTRGLTELRVESLMQKKKEENQNYEYLFFRLKKI